MASDTIVFQWSSCKKMSIMNDAVQEMFSLIVKYVLASLYI